MAPVTDSGSQHLAFLRQHQPFPIDTEVTQDQLDRFSAAHQYFIDNVDPRCLRLFLGAMGGGTGCGRFQLLDNLFRDYPRSEVISAIVSELLVGHGSIDWAVEMAPDWGRWVRDPVLEALSRDGCDLRLDDLEYVAGMLADGADEAEIAELERALRGGEVEIGGRIIEATPMVASMVGEIVRRCAAED